MKTTLYVLVLFFVVSLTAIPAFSQFNPATNSFGIPVGNNLDAAVSPGEVIRYAAPDSVPCTANTFWAIAGTSLDQFTLISGTITKVGTTSTIAGIDPTLAFCNNLNGSSYSPTFYSVRRSDTIVYYNGTGITKTNGILKKDFLINAGGYGDFLYYIRYDSATFRSVSIMRYNGANLTTVYTFPAGTMASVADLAVDNAGFVWFFSGPDNIAVNTDTLKVVSPGGVLSKQYPVAFNTYNAYGCFMLNGIIYVGLGASHPTHPKTVVPVTVNSGGASVGTPIAMPSSTAYSDMASCTPGTPNGVNEIPSLSGISVFPNPVSDRLYVQSSSGETLEIVVYDVASRELIRQPFSGSLTLNTAFLSAGTYIYTITNKAGGIFTGKLVKGER